jgi:trypsin-like peptidase
MNLSRCVPWIVALVAGPALAQTRSGSRVEHALVQPALLRESRLDESALRSPEIAPQRFDLPATVRPRHVSDGQVGYLGPVPLAVTTGIAWHPLASGARVIRCELTSRNAAGLRFSLRRDALPSLLQVRMYVPGQQRTLGPFYPALDAGGGEWWSPVVLAPTVGVEFYLGPGAAVGPPPRPSLESMSYIFSIEELGCHNPILDHPEWATEASGVMMICFNDIDCDGTLQPFGCSASLMNRPANDLAPLVLTANHCINNEAAANSISFVWFFDSPTSTTTQTVGATLLLNDPPTDCALLGLKMQPPGGAAFLGYDAGAWAAGDNVACIHHPEGTYKRISFGTLTGAMTIGSKLCGNVRNKQTWFVTFGSGTMEHGSSGAPLFDGNHRVRGPASAMPESLAHCAPDTGYFGRLDLAFPNFAPYLATMPNPVWMQASYAGTYQNGTSAYPFTTLLKAASVVRAGDQIAILPGIYHDQMTLYRPMTLTAPSGGVTIGQ